MIADTSIPLSDHACGLSAPVYLIMLLLLPLLTTPLIAARVGVPGLSHPIWSCKTHRTTRHGDSYSDRRLRIQNSTIYPIVDLTQVTAIDPMGCERSGVKGSA